MATSNNLVANVRNYLRKLARSRKTRTVTADDVHSFFKGRKMTVSNRLSVINSAFSAPEFTPVGETASQREAARYRKITEYKVSR